MTNGNGQPWRLQAGFNSSQSGDIGWSTVTVGLGGNSLPDVKSGASVILTHNRVYIVGGVEDSSIYTCPINSDGTLAAWTSGTNLPHNSGWSPVIVTSTRVYLLGGVNTGGACITAIINADGTLGTWGGFTYLLPFDIQYSQAVVTVNRVYLIGGVDNYNAAAKRVYTNLINANGTLSTWSDTGNDLPLNTRKAQAVVTSSRVYILGGEYGNEYSSTYYANINNNGTLGTWTLGTTLPVPLAESQAVITTKTVYLLGGASNGTYKNNVWYAPVNLDGSIGTWVTQTAGMPYITGRSQVIVTSSRIFMLGGYNSDYGATTRIMANAFSGGLNDYMSLPVIGANTSTEFTLPDLSASDATTTGMYSYIKI